MGTDVNTAQRLTKNHVVEETGCEAYALFSRAVVEALGWRIVYQVGAEFSPVPRTEQSARADGGRPGPGGDTLGGGVRN